MIKTVMFGFYYQVGKTYLAQINNSLLPARVTCILV